MRTWMFLLCLLANISIQGRAKDSILHRINFQAHVTFFMPTGQFSAKDGNSYFLGQSKNGIGFSPSVLARAYKNFHAGIYGMFNNYWLDRGKLQTKPIQNFKETGYYTSANVRKWDMSIISGGLEYSYKFKTSFCDVAPYLDIGIAFVDGSGNYSATTVHKKRMNENYYEDITILFTKSNIFLYPGIGVRLEKKIHKIFYLTFGLQYNYGETGYNLIYDKRDFLGNTNRTTVHYNQHISALQAQAGVQLRVFKAKRFRHK